MGDILKVSIITATYNSQEYISKTYESIKKQTYKDWEWIVTDDCSSDDTYSILSSIADNDIRVKLFVNKVNSGAAIARNNSLDFASGEFVAFIDSDDLWEPEKLSMQLEFMQESNSDFSFTAYQLISNDGALLGKTIDSSNSGSFNYFDMLKKRATLGCSTVIISKTLLNERRMPNIRTGQDYAFWLSIMKSGHSANILPVVLTKYRISNNSISRNKFKKALRQWEIYRGFEKLGVIKSLFYFVFYAFHAVFRRA
ncbi:glycosyl transferase family 2 [Pseudoalteromonas sp. GCY]|uniref:glycosyltransferase family 2 protein n=1 Tax=Pseudoalteromonas sp. GCY TaxID=2003316 RepID=UPI000BFF065C|nr:glycosyltransferase family 2 protein [Pseudoalteromonas sp. GCY]PHI34875.1 glycosyl transferase family 2 [Pseudoalteromonas sp. GCY]QQQ67759.1 glycosyltransferase family 2 protein [Pseudoalteromonas sp. GCY]